MASTELPSVIADAAGTRTRLVVAAWVVVVGASTLPQVILREGCGLEVTDDARAVIAASVIGLAIVAATRWARLRPLLRFLVVLLTLVGAQWLVFRVIGQMPLYRVWLADPSFTTHIVADQSLRLTVTCLVIASLLVMRGRPARFFLTIGDVHAPMRPVRWLGVRKALGGAASGRSPQQPSVPEPSPSSSSPAAPPLISWGGRCRSFQWFCLPQR